MISKSLFVVAAAAAAGGAFLTSPATAAAQTAPISSIYSAAQNTCLDTSMTDPSRYFLDSYGHPCNGSTSQAFAFQAVSGAPTGTYDIVSQATGQCLSKYRLGIRQTACSNNPEWTLQPVGTAGNQYRFAVTSLPGDCVQVYPTPSGYPGPLFNLAGCSSNAAQVLTLSTTP